MDDNELTPQQQAIAHAVSEALGYGTFANMLLDFDGGRETVFRVVAAVQRAVPPLSWLNHQHQLLATCPGCGQAGLDTIGIHKLAHTYEVCECGTPDYPHMVEQLWHREHMTGQPSDKVAWTTRRATLGEASRLLWQVARKGELGARGRTQLTYEGGLRSAARQVDNLITEMEHRES